MNADNRNGDGEEIPLPPHPPFPASLSAEERARLIAGVEKDRAELLGLSADLSGAQTLESAWEPVCVAHAFRMRRPQSKIEFTMQVWIDLDAVRSPLLQFERLGSLEEVERALEAFGIEVLKELLPEDGMALAEEMLEAVMDGFAMRVEMRDPEAGDVAVRGVDGFGAWLPLWACLLTQCGRSDAEACAMKVGKAYALVGAMRRNQGWVVVSGAYSMRDRRAEIGDGKEEEADQQTGREESGEGAGNNTRGACATQEEEGA